MASSSIPVFALDESNQIVEAATIEDSQGNKYKIEILEDNDSLRVVRVESENGITEATYDQMNHTIEFDEDGIKTQVSIEDPEEQVQKEKDRQKRSTKNIVREAQDMYFGYYYVIDKSGGKKYWDVGNIKRGTYVKQTSRNKADLFDFEDKVLDLIKAETAFVANSTVSTAAFMASVKGIKSGWGEDRMIAFFASAGFGMAAAINAADVVLIERKTARALDNIMEK
ncbi:geobacillin-26 family protein [Brevibacillus laterosporus]|uniref:geobacillin-26 family protein n=1 Tax=Brevibacillus laterosporus TaxID=1465 RepID=UPI00264F213C|nr:geobacillin-26 family protein [Brevibacillus laterosporus]MDN9011553.1 geobacillin-26 family protein [Brevibacillus laterosporus]MDO0942814.1 geobacillin-26 family protein [Brevibacillus laterosporus]